MNPTCKVCVYWTEPDACRRHTRVAGTCHDYWCGEGLFWCDEIRIGNDCQQLNVYPAGYYTLEELAKMGVFNDQT